MSAKISCSEISFTPINNRRLMELCGRFNEHLHQIESRLQVEINNRGETFQILGEEPAVQLTSDLLNQLYAQTENGIALTPAKVHLFLQQTLQKLSKHPTMDQDPSLDNTTPSEEIKTPKMVITPHSKTQRLYLKSIKNHDVNFGIGPAGTGKTYLAVACAVAALEAQKVKRIFLVRPAVEAGERLGFLPGDLSQKIDPYLKPLYDALYDMLGFEYVSKLIEKNVIELAPLAYMRGRTLNDAFIILDESQNTTREQMKMFLTRLGFGSKVVITGDITQIDLPYGVTSGLNHVIKVLADIPEMSFTFFDSSDIVRHPLVQKIVLAYDQFEKDLSKGEK